MTTALHSALIAAGYFASTDHLLPKEVEDSHIKGEITLVAGQYVHACPIPTGYLEQQARLNKLSHTRQTTQVRMVAKEKMVADGYSTVEEFNTAQLREAARWIGNNDYPLDRVLVEPLERLEAPRKAQPVTVRKRNHFHPSQLDEEPLSLISIDDQRRIVDQARLASRILEGTADWDAALTIIPCKMIDSMLLYGCERIIANIEEQGRATVQKIANVRRESTSEEIAESQIDRLNARRIALRVQHRHMSLLLKGFREERDDTVSRAGIDWPKYLSIKQRAERGAQAYRSQKSARAAQLDQLIGKTPAQLAEFNRNNRPYKPRADGVDAPDEVPYIERDPE